MPSYVYLVEAGGRHKIGTTIDPVQRLKHIACHSSHPPTLVGVFFGDDREEKALHAEFAAYRLHGEWFAFPPAVLITLAERFEPFVPAPKAPPAPPEPVLLDWPVPMDGDLSMCLIVLGPCPTAAAAIRSKDARKLETFGVCPFCELARRFVQAWHDHG